MERPRPIGYGLLAKPLVKCNNSMEREQQIRHKSVGQLELNSFSI